MPVIITRESKVIVMKDLKRTAYQKMLAWKLAKGATHGGIADRVYTIPVYGISKFKF